MTQSEPSDLANANPGWHIWQADGGTGMATRRTTLTDRQIYHGLASTLMGGRFDPPLAEQLAEQARIEAELAASP